MATLATLTDAIENVIHDDDYTDELTSRIDDAINGIAGGIRLPDGTTSSPLPELYALATVATTANPYADLPANYQRRIFYVVDSSGDRILPPAGTDYYGFMLFLNGSLKKDLSETGSVTRVCVKGKRLYYQGIPSISKDLTVHYYRKPVRMTESADTPDGIPEHLQMRLIKHYVCRDIYGEGIEDGAESKKIGTSYHASKFLEAMVDLVDFIGIDAEPEYYRSDASDCIIEY